MHLPRRLIVLTGLAGLAAGLHVSPAAVASAGCPELATAPLFERWGDHAGYSLAPGGGFEGPLSWAAVGSPSLVPENNPFGLSGAGRTSVLVQGRESITSPPVCVTSDQPYLRFVTRAKDPDSRLVTEVLWNDKGVYKEEVLDEHPADLWGQWRPSKLVPLGAALPTGSDEVHEVRLRFRLKDGEGSWLVDDVFVDPLKRG